MRLFRTCVVLTQFRIQVQHQEEVDRKDNTNDDFYCHNIQIYGLYYFERRCGVKVSFST